MPRDEQEFHFDSLDRARKRLEAQDTPEKSTKEPVKRQIEAGTVHDRDELLPTECDPAMNPGSRFDSIREHRFLAPMRGGLPTGEGKYCSSSRAGRSQGKRTNRISGHAPPGR